MLYPPELLDRLQAITPAPWAGQAFRHMFGDYPPDAENTRGARWNPPGVAAIYTSLARDGALAEAEHQIAVQPIPHAPGAPSTRSNSRLPASWTSPIPISSRASASGRPSSQPMT